MDSTQISIYYSVGIVILLRADWELRDMEAVDLVQGYSTL